ncbi:hypothetical protein Glove_851g4 [Diversispora epigaea]|uniref:Protein kinase domain-containing protein n=1 Tax=Diversispora epigaea TaxID=1348612 RepID=A0A397FZ87_9GLOM|nr:hypothetical protein Glove_851g4 [Diversispora epigaea]
MATQEIKWNAKLRGVWDKGNYSLNIDVHKTFTEKEKYRKDLVESDSSLTENEKKFLFNELQKLYDALRIGNNSEILKKSNNATVKIILEITSGNNEIDKLIQECQQTTISSDRVIEWISYDQFENINYLSEGGCSTIYTAIWKDGCYYKWNSEKLILKRFGRQMIVLKRLNNSNNSNVHWFQEVTLSFTLDNTSTFLALCYGITKEPTTQDYMLVLSYYNNDLRHFLKDNFQSLTLLQKYSIVDHIVNSLNKIHKQNILHRDLHSGNILHCAQFNTWYISDLGLSGPVNKQLDSIYGNLPYIAPELLYKKKYTKKSNVYSLGIILWEVITGETPFSDHEFNSDSDFALAIINGYRPKLYKYIPYEYATLMKQCWDAIPDNRPDAETISNEMDSLVKSLYNEMDEQHELTIPSNNSKSKFSQSSLTEDKSTQKIQTSKVYTFNISAQPRNATEEQQLAYETKQFDFEIPEGFEQLSLNNVVDVDNSNNSQDN